MIVTKIIQMLKTIMIILMIMRFIKTNISEMIIWIKDNNTNIDKSIIVKYQTRPQ